MDPDCMQCIATLVLVHDQQLEIQQAESSLRKLKRQIRKLKRKLRAAESLLDEQDALITLIVNEN